MTITDTHNSKRDMEKQEDQETINNSLFGNPFGKVFVSDEGPSPAPIPTEASSQSRVSQQKSIQCKAIKRNGHRCRQSGKSNQGGGLIIQGFCDYHTKYRP